MRIQTVMGLQPWTQHYLLFTMVPGENYVNIDAGLAIGALPVRYADLHAEWKGIEPD